MTPEQEGWELEQALAGAPVPTGNSSVSKQLVDLALSESTFVRGSDGITYAVRARMPVVRQLRGEDSFRRQLAARFHDHTGRVPSQAALADALVVLEGRAADQEPVAVHDRAAFVDGKVLIDLGRSDQLLVEISAAGWEVRSPTSADPLFKRRAAMGVMPLPIKGGWLDPLWHVLNVRLEDRPLLTAWIAAALMPQVPQPFLLLRGEQGTGKSTAAKVLIGLLDPGAGGLASPPRDERGWAAAASGRTMVGVDNLSVIPAWLSDTFCRTVTGDEIVSRRLYTDGEAHITRIRAALVMTSIDPGSLRGDLAERMLPVELERLDQARRREEDLYRELAEQAPSVLGAVFDLVALALREMPRLKAPPRGWPRMAEFGSLLAALDGDGGTALEQYQRVLADVEADVAAGDPLADAIVRLVEREGGWTGEASALIPKLMLDSSYPPEVRKGWSTAQALSASLTRLAPGLRRLGVEVDRRRSNGKRLLVLKRISAD